MTKLQKLLIINSLSYRWSEMKIPGSESLAKLSQLQRLILVVLLEVRYSAYSRPQFRALVKGLYWGFGYPKTAAAAVSLSRALARLEERGYIVRHFPGCWELTCSPDDLVRNGWFLALAAWGGQKEIYTKIGLKGPTLQSLGLSAPEPAPEPKGVQVTLKF
jgi:hypothetical protein